MTNTKSGNLYLKIFEKAMTIIIVLNLIIVSCSTAFVGIKNLVSNNTYSSKKQEMIDYVFDTNLKNNLLNGRFDGIAQLNGTYENPHVDLNGTMIDGTLKDYP